MNTAVNAASRDELNAVNQEIERLVQHQNAGRIQEAEAMIDGLLERFPNHPRIVHLKGLNLSLQGETSEAMRLLQKVVDAKDDDAVARVDLGIILAGQGDIDAAIEHFQAAVEMSPNLALAHANLGAALVLKKSYGPAINHLKKASELDGTIFDVHMNLAQANIRSNHHAAAIDPLYKALSIDPKSAAAHSNLAHALYRSERHDTAEYHARRALDIAPDAAETKLHLGAILGASGRNEEAINLLLPVCNVPGVGIQALSRVIHMRKTKPDSPELKILEAYLGQSEKIGHEEQTATLFLAAGKAFDDLGDYDRAIDCFNTGNAATAKVINFDLDAFRARIEAMETLFTPEVIAAQSSTARADIAPIFIVGMPRSGTTLMDQMFSRHPDVQAGGELRAANMAFGRNANIRAYLERQKTAEDLTDDDFARLGEDYIAGLHAEGLRAGYVSDKMPGNYMFVGPLAMALPRAKFLIMRRHPMDCLFSNYMQNFGQNQPFSNTFEGLGGVYSGFDRLADYWAKVLPHRTMQVHYEDVVADPEGKMRDVMGFIGLEWTDEILDHTTSTHQVNTASSAQVREPIYDRAVARWRRYGPRLKGLAQEVRGHLTAEEQEVCGLS